MSTSILLPGVSLEPGFILPVHEEYLRTWQEDAVSQATSGVVSASLCQQGMAIDLVLAGRSEHDWIGVIDEFLVDNGKPIAYSVEFGRKLHKFGNQYLQTTLHALHTRWWIEGIVGQETLGVDRIARWVLGKRQTDGLLYDRDVSPTVLRHRMQTELTMSMALGVEMLRASGMLSQSLALELATDVVAPKKCPRHGYLSMEYFRLTALRILEQACLFPCGIEEDIRSCQNDLPVGWCDFPMSSKVDSYMGTAKRTARDKPIHSPLTGCHVRELRDAIRDRESRDKVTERLLEYCCYLQSNPMGIPAFQMRDVPIPFGSDKTPNEVICASWLVQQCQ